MENKEHAARAKSDTCETKCNTKSSCGINTFQK